MPLPVELDPGPDAELDRMERAKRWHLLDAIDTAVATLAADKLQLHNRVDLVRYAIEHGLDSAPG